MENQRKTTTQLWEVLSGGINVQIETAQDLWEQALAYFQWIDANPIQVPEMIKTGVLAGDVKSNPKTRPYTIPGLCLYIGIDRAWLFSCAKQTEKNDFYFVATKIIEIIYTQKLELALVGAINPVIAAKELGLNKDTESDDPMPIIKIESVQGPKLLEDESDIDFPKQTNDYDDNLEIQ